MQTLKQVHSLFFNFDLSIYDLHVYYSLLWEGEVTHVYLPGIISNLKLIPEKKKQPVFQQSNINPRSFAKDALALADQSKQYSQSNV